MKQKLIMASILLIAGCHRSEQGEELHDVYEQSLELFTAYVLPNSLARKEGFDIDAHLRRIRRQRETLIRRFDNPGGLAYLARRRCLARDEIEEAFLKWAFEYLEIKHERAVRHTEKVLPPYSIPKNTRPWGRLGFPVGTYVRIEGHPYRPTKPPIKVHGRTLTIDTIQGKRLSSPVRIVVKNADIESLENDTRCILNGYESGAWIGSPDGLPPGTPVGQVPFQFHHFFVVTSVEAPKGLLLGR
jgi:hypothetical protein